MTPSGPARRRKESDISDLSSTFERTVDEGEFRLHRSWPRLLATGLVGGADVSLGVFALLIVEEATGDKLLAALAFSIGFVALTLANSELFTENFLVPLLAVAAAKAPALQRWPSEGPI
jgi:formate/nitrite transporter FocA (FNT family)